VQLAQDSLALGLRTTPSPGRGRGLRGRRAGGRRRRSGSSSCPRSAETFPRTSITLRAFKSSVPRAPQAGAAKIRPRRGL